MATRLDFLCIPLRLGGGVFVVVRMCRNFVFPIVVLHLEHTVSDHDCQCLLRNTVCTYVTCSDRLYRTMTVANTNQIFSHVLRSVEEYMCPLC